MKDDRIGDGTVVENKEAFRPLRGQETALCQFLISLLAEYSSGCFLVPCLIYVYDYTPPPPAPPHPLYHAASYDATPGTA